MQGRWSIGDRVVRREVWRDRTWTGLPMRVVHDDDDLLALYLPTGSPVGFAAGRFPISTDRHPWDTGGPTTWWGHGVLHLHRSGDPYCVIVFWEGPDRAFSRWYVNFQEPYRRATDAIETLDHVLDIVIPAEGGWSFKDDDEVDEAVALGLYSTHEAAAVRACGRDVGAMIDNGSTWWSDDWADWAPAPELDVPYDLPAHWARRDLDEAESRQE